MSAPGPIVTTHSSRPPPLGIGTGTLQCGTVPARPRVVSGSRRSPAIPGLGGGSAPVSSSGRVEPGGAPHRPIRTIGSPADVIAARPRVVYRADPVSNRPGAVNGIGIHGSPVVIRGIVIAGPIRHGQAY